MGFHYFMIFLMCKLTGVYVDVLKEAMYAKTSNQSIGTWANAIGQTIKVPGHFHCAGHCLKNNDTCNSWQFDETDGVCTIGNVCILD